MDELLQNQIQAIPETRDAMEMWQEFCVYCKKMRARIVLLRNVPSPEAQRALVNITGSKEEICPWVLKLKPPTHISTIPLRRPEVGLEGTPVYSYIVDFDAHNYYMAFFEKIPRPNSNDKKIVLKSLKLDERDNRNAPLLCCSSMQLRQATPTKSIL